MIRKYFIQAGIIASTVLSQISTRFFPGDSGYDQNSIGYDWKNNYLSNLLNANAVNGSIHLRLYLYLFQPSLFGGFTNNAKNIFSHQYYLGFMVRIFCKKRRFPNCTKS